MKLLPWFRSRSNDEIEEELRSHIQHRADDLERSGVLNHAYWHSHFQDDLCVIGHTVLLNKIRYSDLTQVVQHLPREAPVRRPGAARRR